MDQVHVRPSHSVDKYVKSNKILVPTRVLRRQNTRYKNHQLVAQHCFVASFGLMKNEQQSENLLLKGNPRSTFRNNFLQSVTNVFAARQVDYAK